MPSSDPRFLLLDLIALRRPLPDGRVASLGEDEWQAIDAMAAEHRLRPLLHRRLTADPVANVPDALAARWADAYRQVTLRSLALQHELLSLHDLAQGAGIPYIALKGAYLAWHAYPEPGLRPLRDLDLLVPRDRAMELFRQLLDRGYARSPHYPGDAEASLQSSHQLPPLVSRSGTVVEVHTRLFHRDERRRDVCDPSQGQAFWDRAVERTMGGRPLRFPTPEDILVHLIEHAVYGHQFDNGPLLFSDIAFLLERHAIDWPLFWRLADKARCRRGAMLTFGLVRHYWPGTAIVGPRGEPDSVPQPIIDAAARASLRSRDHRDSDHLLVNARLEDGGARRASHIWRRLFPGRNDIAHVYPVRAGSPLILFYYLKRLWTLGTERLPAVMARRSSETVEGLVLIHRWLDRRS